MRVLIACEFSGVVRDAFRNHGHDAWSCDFEDSEGEWLEYHIKDDCRAILNDNWDLLIAHPPCTYLCNSGVRWLWEDESRWEHMWEAADFFLELLNCSIPRRAIENPIMHKYARKEIGVDYTQIIQPFDFGHNETKATCLWLCGLPKLRITKYIAHNVEDRVHKAKPSPTRWKERSRTPAGIAEAFASQWGSTPNRS